MEIRTSYTSTDKQEFERFKRRSKGEWKFLASGEWSESPYHQGNHTFYIRSDAMRQYWSLLSVGFPNQIIAVAYTPGPQELEVVAVAMLRAVRANGGDYIDTLDSVEQVDRSRFWMTYRSRAEAA
jgi:hypothetical protein